MAESSLRVKIFRNSEFLEVDSSELVPGDIYIPKEKVPCDSIIIKDDLFVS